MANWEWAVPPVVPLAYHDLGGISLSSMIYACLVALSKHVAQVVNLCQDHFVHRRLLFRCHFVELDNESCKQITQDDPKHNVAAKKIQYEGGIPKGSMAVCFGVCYVCYFVSFCSYNI